MKSEAAVPGNNDLPRGLPPVTPPSGRFIIQLFLVPGLVVAVAVVVLLGARYLFGSVQSTDRYLHDLDSSNADIRWRGAHDLAQVLKRPESLALASDPKFALDIAERLRKALDEVAHLEKTTAERTAKLSQAEKDAGWRSLATQRNHLLYLAACLGDFTVPVGVPLLSDMALRDDGPDLKATTLRRRHAVWTLVNLGANVQHRYLGINSQPGDKVLTAEQKAAIEAELQQEAAGTGNRAAWARNALYYLDKNKRADSAMPLVRADQTLDRCSRADDPYLRELVALASNFWEGDLLEPMLLRLAHDDGHGQRIEINEND
jgi:hypothetical protein